MPLGAARCAALALGGLLLAGCAGGVGGGTGSGAMEARDDAARNAEAAPGGPAAGGPNGASEAGRQAGQARAPSKGRGTLPKLAPQDRDVIYTASLTVRTRDVGDALSRSKQLVRDVGGFVHAEHVTGDRENRDDRGDTSADTSADLTLKVPPGEFQPMLDRLSDELGTLLERQQNAKDVTEKVADVESRINSAEASLERLRTLLDKADSVSKVLEVEEQLAQREEELESLQARADALADKTRYATITVHLRADQRRDQTPGDGPVGFLSGFFSGWNAFKATAGWASTGLGAVLPFVVPLGAIIAAAWWLRRTIRRRLSVPDSAESGQGTTA